ncbi:feruloyl-CoA synthase [Derxia lacustris]|uniref:feruloyl-CoA synthase n=1 Tax=Derxia lacustris TaxID=764842 RepID=UPI000A174353|nr:feruloyl-CoA synthase [Derxia lacustris]
MNAPLNIPPRYRDTRVGGCVDATVETRADGSLVLRSTEPLGAYPDRVTDRLELWAQVAPHRTYVAQRDKTGEWRRVTYAQALAQVKALAQAFVDMGLSAERPIAILSDNDIEHLILALGALWAGVPYTPVSPAYSLVSKDFGKLRHVLGKLTPGLVFASSATPFAAAIEAVVPADVQLVFGEGALPGRASHGYAELLATPYRDSGAAAHAAVGPDTIAKFLFTSGSTKDPKGVINTHRMLCSNQQMVAQSLAFLTEEPPVLVDWLPWNHTFGGNKNVGLVLYNGGTLYIDGGKPTPNGIAETLRNLREIAPTVYFNVPKGFEEIAHAMERDDELRERLFSRVKAFFFAGAGLAQAVWDKLDALAEKTVGERIPMYSGLGMTETAPSAIFALRNDVAAGHIGLPCPGVEVKLVPVDGKTEIRFRGPNVMPGYWREPEQTAEAFDEEGFYKTGDAVQLVDPTDVKRGLLFDGRIAEDFKLSTGTFVSVGALRAKVLAIGAPLVQDSVVTGMNRDDIGLLIFPQLTACRAHAGLPADTPAPEVLHHPKVREFFQDAVDRLWREGTGSANRVARAHLMAEPPSLDAGELTDKGSINQRAVLKQRAALVEALYDGRTADPWLILPHRF